MAIDEYEGIPLPFEVEDEEEARRVVEEMLDQEDLDAQQRRGVVGSDDDCNQE